MRSYTITKISGTPDWNAVPVMPIDNLLWTESCEVQAQGQLCWDENAIYVRLAAKETQIRAENRGRLDEVCEDSCLEFFLQPTEDGRYFNFEFNPNCALYLGIGTSISDLVRLVVRDQQELFAPKAQYTKDGWEITYEVPFSFIRRFFPDFEPKTGLQMRGNCYKCGDLTPNPHFLAWSPMSGDTPRFHHSPDYGALILG